MRYSLALILALSIGGAACDSTSSSAPVYYGQVQRILDESCVECHSASAERLAPFSLATYDDAVAAARGKPMAHAVMTRSMPPYFATNDGSCQTFTTKWLSDADLDTLVAWLGGDLAAGDPARSVPPPAPMPGLPAVDATLDLGFDYTPDARLADDYRCFVVDALGSTPGERFVTGAHIRPQNLSVAHHVIVFSLDSEQAQGQAEALDAADPGPGYACSAGGPVDSGATFLVGWAPGNGAQLFPAGTGIPVSNNRKLVVQMHYNLAASNGQPDRTRIELDLADAVAARGTMVPVRADVNLPPRTREATATGVRRLPANLGQLRLWGSMVHMHQRGTSAELSLSGSQSTCLARLGQWNFHWQHYYPYAAPIAMSGGDTVTLTCRYDTSNDTAPVRWGEGTDDEMCIAYLYVSQ